MSTTVPFKIVEIHLFEIQDVEFSGKYITLSFTENIHGLDKISIKGDVFDNLTKSMENDYRIHGLVGEEVKLVNYGFEWDEPLSALRRLPYYIDKVFGEK
jgi:hypothetical protein